MSEVARGYSYNKAMGPDRRTEAGIRRRHKQETKTVSEFLSGRRGLKDLRTDLVILPKEDEEVHIN